MQHAKLYIATLLIFLVTDAVMLTLYMTPLFREHVGHLMAVPIRGLPAVGFYLFYVAAILYLASLPARRAGAMKEAVIRGAVLGGAAYGTFEFTSYAIFADWHVQMLISDTIWGAVLTGFSAWAGLRVTGAVRTP